MAYVYKRLTFVIITYFLFIILRICGIGALNSYTRFDSDMYVQRVVLSTFDIHVDIAF